MRNADDVWDVRSVSLPSLFDIKAVTTVAVELLDAVQAGDLVLDARPLTRIDAAALQLLYAAVAAARARGAHVTWAGSSAVLDEAARVLALAEALDLPESRMQEAA